MISVVEITVDELDALLKSGSENGEHSPRGLFFAVEERTYIGVDNTTGEAWVQGFTSLRGCIKWLLREDDDNE